MNKLINKLLYPKSNIVIIGIINIVLSLFYLIYFNKFGSPLSYVLYLTMTYSLIIVWIKLYTVIRIKLNIFIDNNKYLRKYKRDYKLRYQLSLFVSLLFNVIYALFEVISGILFSSWWFISLAIYYLLLIMLRFNILRDEFDKKKELREEYIRYRSTAIILLFINVILTMIIMIIVNQKIINVYPNWLAITVAVYTFYLIFSSIYNLIKYRKYKSPLISSAKVISVITSLVSLISLEIILIPTFGVDNIEFFEIMIMATGGGIAIIIMIISLYMIIRATEWLNDYID